MRQRCKVKFTRYLLPVKSQYLGRIIVSKGQNNVIGRSGTKGFSQPL
ncbi:MAG: hypothetical protein GF398_02910 [Chitinivibrionales bacterium]|nr:hypothetical protein [Chitinivibrionales bacterium]